jgi:hypothetical protein
VSPRERTQIMAINERAPRSMTGRFNQRLED